MEDTPFLDEHLNPVTHARSTDPGTSHAAARDLWDKRTMMQRLLTVIAHIPCTAEQAAVACQYDAADGSWKRVSDLHRAGLIEPTGETRPGRSGRQQRVFRATDAGREALR